MNTNEGTHCHLHFNHEMKWSCRRHLALLNIKYHTPFEPSHLIISYKHTKYIKCFVCVDDFTLLYTAGVFSCGSANVCSAASIQIFSKILTLNGKGVIETKNCDTTEPNTTTRVRSRPSKPQPAVILLLMFHVSRVGDSHLKRNLSLAFFCSFT